MRPLTRVSFLFCRNPSNNIVVLSTDMLTVNNQWLHTELTFSCYPFTCAVTSLSHRCYHCRHSLLHSASLNPSGLSKFTTQFLTFCIFKTSLFSILSGKALHSLRCEAVPSLSIQERKIQWWCLYLNYINEKNYILNKYFIVFYSMSLCSNRPETNWYMACSKINGNEIVPLTNQILNWQNQGLQAGE